MLLCTGDLHVQAGSALALLWALLAGVRGYNGIVRLGSAIWPGQKQLG